MAFSAELQLPTKADDFCPLLEEYRRHIKSLVAESSLLALNEGWKGAATEWVE